MIFDGGSQDGSVDIIRKYQKYLTYWESVKDRGQSHAINKGLQRAGGDIFNWLNSDDYYEPGALHAIASSFDDPRLMLVSGRSRLFKHQNTTLAYSNGTDIYTGNLEKTIGQARVDQPETFYRMEAIRRIGPLNESLHYLMDRDLWIRFLLEYGLGATQKIDRVLVNFRLHERSKTVSQRNGFEAESFLLYRSLASSAGASEIYQVFCDLHKAESGEIQYSLNENQAITINKSLHYFLLYLCDNYYYLGHDKLSRLLLSFIDQTMLGSTDIQLLKKLSFRQRWIPFWVRKLFHT